MPRRKNPTGHVKLDRKLIFACGLEFAGIRSGIVLRTTLPRASDQRNRAVGRDIRKTHEPIGQRRGRRNLQEGSSSTEDRGFLNARGGIVNEAVSVNRPLVRSEIAPPEAGFAADGRNIL